MSDQDDSGGSDSRQESSSESLDLVKGEARAVIDAQLEVLRSTDEKALATVRITSLILGIFVSAASLSDAPVQFTGPLFFLGGGLLFGSTLVAIISYTADRPSYGIGPGYLDDVYPELNSQPEIKRDLLDRYANWIEDNSREIATDSFYLSVSQSLLILGLLAIATGVWRVL